MTMSIVQQHYTCCQKPATVHCKIHNPLHQHMTMSVMQNAKCKIAVVQTHHTCSQQPAAATRCTATFAARCCHCSGGYLLSAALVGTSQQGKSAKIGTSCCIRCSPPAASVTIMMVPLWWCLHTSNTICFSTKMSGLSKWLCKACMCTHTNGLNMSLVMFVLQVFLQGLFHTGGPSLHLSELDLRLLVLWHLGLILALSYA